MKKVLPGIFSLLLLSSPASELRAQPCAGLTMADARANTYFTAPALKAPPLNQARRQSAADLPELRGSVIYSSQWGSNAAPGLYGLNADGSFTLQHPGPLANGGGVEIDGTFYATTVDRSFTGAVSSIITTGYDLATGEAVYSCSSTSLSAVAYDLARDHAAGLTYGIFYRDSGDGYFFGTIDYTPGAVQTTRIADLEGEWHSIAVDSRGMVYAISREMDASGEVTASTLCRIDPSTGAVTPVGPTGVKPVYVSSATIDPATDRMFWAVNPREQTGLLYEVDLATGAATQLLQFAGNEEVTALHVPQRAAAGVPGAATDMQAEFRNGSLSGRILFTAPTALADGTPATGNISYTLEGQGFESVRGTAAYGQRVTNAWVDLRESGEYSFVVSFSNEAGSGPRTALKAFVGNGVPAAPANVKATFAAGKVQLSWDPVTTSSDGGYINPAQVRYNVVRLPAGVEVMTKTSQTSITESLKTAADAIESHSYSVSAVFDGRESAPALSNAIFTGSLPLPYSEDFSLSEKLDLYTVVDANDDGYTWTARGGNAIIGANLGLPMDDWLITPPIAVEEGKLYMVSFDARCHNASFPEMLEVCFGQENTVRAMTGYVLSSLVVGNAEYKRFQGKFKAPATGMCFIGIHGISDEGMWNLYLDNLRIDEGMLAQAPAAVTALKATPGADGAYSATVGFRAPQADLDGSPLTAIDRIVVSRDGVDKTITGVGPGESYSYIDILDGPGDVVYTVRAWNSAGAGEEASCTVRVGLDKPARPDGATIAETDEPGVVTVGWTTVNSDCNGNYIDPSRVTYAIAKRKGSVWEIVAEGLTGREHTFRAVDEGRQEFVQLAVYAATEGGMGEGELTAQIPAGTPYRGMNESFAGLGLSYIFGTAVHSGEAAWTLLNEDSGIPPQDADGGLAAMSGQDVGCSASLITGKIDLSALIKPELTFYSYTLTGDSGVSTNILCVEISTDGGKTYSELMRSSVADISPQPGWHKVTLSLQQWADRTVRIRFTGTTKLYQYTAIDRVRVGSVVDRDLGVESISAPAQVSSGDEFDLAVTVMNHGIYRADSYSLSLYADDRLLESRSLQALNPDARSIVTFRTTMHPLSQQPVTYRARVSFEADENPANDSSFGLAVVPVLSDLPYATSLSATERADGSGVDLAWTAPDLTALEREPRTESFEGGEAFATTYEGWTFVDADDSAVAYPGFGDLPGIVHGQTRLAFCVFDSSFGGLSTTASDLLAPHSGTRYLAAFPRYDWKRPDDWAISPLLADGAGQTISFYAKSYLPNAAEDMEILYSTEGTDPASFTRLRLVEAVPDSWTRYEFDLPAGARHFAVRHISQNGMVLMLDDFSFIPDASDVELTGYNVYRNGEVIATVADPCHLDADVAAAAGLRTYAVTALYGPRGESRGSNEVSIGSSGLCRPGAIAAAVSITGGEGRISVRGAEGLLLTVATADGRLVHSAICPVATFGLPLAPGIYIVAAGQTAAKAVVR